MKLSLLVAASAAAMAFCALGSAQAAPDDNAVVSQGVVGGDYSYVGLNQGLGHFNAYGGELGGIVPLSQDFSGQVIGGYHRLDSNGSGANVWNIAGTVAWDRPMGRLGLNVGYNTDSLAGANLNLTNYGGYGEYYAGDQATLGVRAGGVTVNANAFGAGTGDRSGGYVGGEAVGYLMPDLAVRGTLGYVGVSGLRQTTAGVHGEYLFSQATPISGWVGYDYSRLDVGFGDLSANTFSVGLKYYFGGSGTLEHHQRTGEDDWGPSTLDLLH